MPQWFTTRCKELDTSGAAIVVSAATLPVIAVLRKTKEVCFLNEQVGPAPNRTA